MKRFLLAGLAGLAVAASGPTNAADLGTRPTYKAPPPVMAPVPFNWTGFYIGANAGYGWGDSSFAFSADNGAGQFLLTGFGSEGIDVHSGRFHTSGFTGGGQLGYNWQFDRTG